MYAQEIEDFSPMSMADEARFQHRNGGTCSFDCAACDPYVDEEFELTDEEVAAAKVALEALEEELGGFNESHPSWF